MRVRTWIGAFSLVGCFAATAAAQDGGMQFGADAGAGGMGADAGAGSMQGQPAGGQGGTGGEPVMERPPPAEDEQAAEGGQAAGGGGELDRPMVHLAGEIGFYVPAGDLADGTVIGFPFILRAGYEVIPKLEITMRFGFAAFVGDPLTTYELMIFPGARYFVFNQGPHAIFAMAEIGLANFWIKREGIAGVPGASGGTSSDFAGGFTFGAGYQWKQVSASLTFPLLFTDGSTFAGALLTAGYEFWGME